MKNKTKTATASTATCIKLTAQVFKAPADMNEASKRFEIFGKLALTANELLFAIEHKKGELQNLEGQLAAMRAQYEQMKPEILGTVAALDQSVGATVTG